MLFPLDLLLPSVCNGDQSFRMRQMNFLYLTKSNKHLTTCCNVTIYTIDTFSDPFHRGQWWVKLHKNSLPANSVAISLRVDSDWTLSVILTA